MIPRILRSTASLALIVSLFWAVPSELSGQNCDEGDTPAFPVPAAYWPADFEPTQPGQQFPARRDSTSFGTTSVPGYQSGHELFVGVATVPGILVAAYNAGFHIWDIGTGQQELPQAEPITFRDGWMNGHFLSFPGFGEVDSYGNSVAAYQDGSTTYIAYSARDAAGFSLWKLNMTPPITGSSLTQLYQDTSPWAYEARFAKIGSTVYAFVAVDGGGGIDVYDVSRANAIGPCLDDGGHTCSNVYKGDVGATTLGKYVEVLETGSGTHLISASKGTSGGVKLWEIGADPTLATLRFSGLASRSHGMAMFEKGGDTYLAVVEQVFGTGGRVKIYDIDACIGSSCSLGSPVWTSRLFAFSGVAQALTYSVSGGIPFLYYGIRNTNMDGAAEDFLADLRTLGTTNQVSYITDGGATFPDSCSGEQVDYFGWYYPRNEDGLANFAPIQGRFEGNYFYRAGNTILDVHVRDGGGGTPTITTTANTAAPHWMDESLDFSAVRTSCTGTGTWSWNHGDSLPAAVVNNGEVAQITYALCATTDCPDRSASVTAAHTACSTATQNAASITLEEPRAQIRSLDVTPFADPQSYPVCTQLSFSTVLDGRDDPFTYSWEVRDAITDELIEFGAAATLLWNTDGVIVDPLPEVFADGFESGDVSGWDFTDQTAPPDESGGGQEATPYDLRAMIEAGGGSRDFNINLTVTNRGGAWSTQTSELLTLTELGALALENPAITSVDLGGGLYDFTAMSSNATEWRWEFEDPDNGTVACTLFSGSCQVLEWSDANSVVSFQWAPPNLPGDYKVGVEIRNCSNESPIGGTILQNVPVITPPEPLEMTSFEIDPAYFLPGDPNRACTWNPIFSEMRCLRGETVGFLAVATGSPNLYRVDWEGDGTFEQSFAVGAAILHVYSSNGTRRPDARAELGASISDPVGLTLNGSSIDIIVADSI